MFIYFFPFFCLRYLQDRQAYLYQIFKEDATWAAAEKLRFLLALLLLAASGAKLSAWNSSNCFRITTPTFSPIFTKLDKMFCMLLIHTKLYDKFLTTNYSD